MTVAATIDIGAERTSALGLGKTPGSAHVAGRTGATAQGSIPPNASGEEVFRAGWQSLLSSLGSNVDGFSEGEENQGAAFARPASGQSSEKPAVPTLAAGFHFRLGQGREKGNDETGAGTKLSSGGAQAEYLMAQPAGGTAKQVKTKTEETNQAEEPATESAHSLRPARSNNPTKADTVLADLFPGLIPAATASLSQAAPVAVLVSLVAQIADTTAQSIQTENFAGLSTHQPSDIISASLSPQIPEKIVSGNNATAVNSAVRKTGEEVEASSRRGLTLPVLSPSGSSGPTLSETDTTDAGIDSPRMIAVHTRGVNLSEASAPPGSLTQMPPTGARNGNPAETPVPSQPSSSTLAPAQSGTIPLAQDHNSIQFAAPNETPAKVFAPIQASAPTFAAEPNRTQAFVPSQTAQLNQSRTAAMTTSQALTPALVPGQEPILPLAQSQNPIQIAAPSLHPEQSQDVIQSITQATSPDTNPNENLTTDQSSSPSLISNQYLSPTFVQNQEQALAQQQNQNVAGTPMPGDGLNSLPVSTVVATSQSGQVVALPSVPSKQGATGGGKASAPEALRPSRGVGNSDSGQHASQQLAGNSSITAVDASTMARALAGAGGTVSVAGQPVGAANVTVTRPDTREAFATLDTAATPEKPTWIHAGAQRAEAGYQDPALGWVSVRADQSGGGVHAQLVPGSADAAQALGSHLAGLNAYLDEHHTPVETLTLTSPEGGWSQMGSGRGTGEGMQQGAGQQTGQGMSQNGDASYPSSAYSDSLIMTPAASQDLPAFIGDIGGSAQAASQGSIHISVMA